MVNIWEWIWTTCNEEKDAPLTGLRDIPFLRKLPNEILLKNWRNTRFWS